MAIITRKKFLVSLAGVSAFAGLPKFVSSQQTTQSKRIKGPALDKELVKEFVGFAHKDFDKVKAMLQENPDLLNSVHNLGGWDWEDAMGAAGHVGYDDLALYLIAQGARPTICVAAMLGQLELVKTFITAFPAMKDAVGPHKISLVRHAKAGGDPAKETLDYLLSIGAKERT
jgi:hypothetical protein